MSYPSTPGFPRCQRFQVSPPRPALSPVPQKPSCAAGVTLFRYVPPVGLVRLSHITRSLGHFLPSAVSRSPNFARNVCRAIRLIGSKERVALPSALRSRTSPIRGMRLQRLLVTELACSCHCRSGAPAGLSAVCVAAWRSAFKHLLGVGHPRSFKANRRACDSAESLHPRFFAFAHCYLQLYSSKRSEVILPLVGTSIRAALPHPITPQKPCFEPQNNAIRRHSTFFGAS